VPAFAASQGIATNPDYAAGAKIELEWLAKHRAELLAGSMNPTVTSLNIPTCASGSIRGEVEVPIAADAKGRELFTSNCASAGDEPGRRHRGVQQRLRHIQHGADRIERWPTA